MATVEGADSPQSDQGTLHHPTGRGDFTAGFGSLLFALVGGFLIVPVWVYVPEKVAGTVDSPAIMPLVMLGLIGLLGTLLLMRTWRAGTAQQSHRSVQDWSRAAGMIAICAGYLILIFVIGLPLATALSLLAAMIYFGERRWALVVPVAILTPLLLWAFFTYIAQVPMPRPMIRLGSHASDHPQTTGMMPHARQVRS